LSRRPILPADSRSLPELRNKFVHFNEAMQNLDIESIRQSAKVFFEQAEAVLSYLADPQDRIFPRVIKVCGIHIDSWGRRRIEAKSDDGKLESIFVDALLQPGAIYLMHPLTNPMRVDPILVPAGDMPETIDTSFTN